MMGRTMEVAIETARVGPEWTKLLSRDKVGIIKLPFWPSILMEGTSLRQQKVLNRQQSVHEVKLLPHGGVMKAKYFLPYFFIASLTAANPEDIKKLDQFLTREESKAPLDLEGADMRPYDLNRPKGKGKEFTGANMKGSLFMGKTIRGIWFEGIDFEGANFEGAKLNWCSFRAVQFARS